MGLILNLETATKSCSVCLANDGEPLATREAKNEGYSHAEQLNLFIQEVLSESNESLKNLDAVAVSAGPGSYTGLRIGTSTAKGICYALNIPLISVNSLKALASLVVGQDGNIMPMFDARRMEVYCALYNEYLQELLPTDAVVIEENSFASQLNEKKIIFTGPGAAKCESIINHQNACFDLETEVSARGMVVLSEAKFREEDFEDVAYFEPAYLKDFIAGPPKKLL
jgi:tRNA threonylcarbamoyladenosine biosynthesis protein TsaB